MLTAKDKHSGEQKEGSPTYKWSVAIFSSRESIEVLAASINSVLNASKGKDTVIDVIVNGNSDLASEVGHHIESIKFVRNQHVMLRVWLITIADKAHAWNQYIHEIWPQSDIAYFIDGYVQVNSDSLTEINNGLDSSSSALAASGVPTTGRSARVLREEMMRSGGIHGNLYAIRGKVVRLLRERKFRLPLGIYRTDPTLGAALAFALDPAHNEWKLKERILVHPEATWSCPSLIWWSLSDLRAQGKRLFRQAQGNLENAAIRDHLAIRRKLPECLPQTVSELVLSWMDKNPWTTRKIFAKNPLCLLAAYKLRHQITLSPQINNPPWLVAHTRG